MNGILSIAAVIAALAPSAIPLVDISGESERQTVIAEGAADRYEGHPTTLLADDGRTMFCVWTTGHGGPCGQMARSDDGGLTWKRLDAELPEVYRRTHKNCPVLQKAKGPDGKLRYFIFSRKFAEGSGLGIMCSEDLGRSWFELPCQSQFPVRMPPTGLMELKDGTVALFGQTFKDREHSQDKPTDDQAVWMAISTDGGKSYGEMRLIMQAEERNLCEPCCLRSPDGEALVILARENRHQGRSMMSFSRDEGQTWSTPVDTPWALTGDRHEGVLLPDGRYVIAFRDRALGSPTSGQFVAWVGTFEDLEKGREGQCRIHLLKHHWWKKDWRGGQWDTGYPGVELLPDGTIVYTTYSRHFDDDVRQNSVVSTRFRIAEIDERLKAQGELVLAPANTEILIAADAPKTVEFALEELTNALCSVWGKVPEVVRKPSAGMRTIALGDNEWSRTEGMDPRKLPRDGFLVKATAEAVYLVGVDETPAEAQKRRGGMYECATVHAVYDFLERFAGVRYYFPGPLGTIMPKAAELRVPLGEYRSAPDFTVRYYSDHSVGEWYPELGGISAVKALGLEHRRLRMRTEKVPCCHGQYKAKFVFRFGKSHPEYFRQDEKGERRIVDTERVPYSANAQLCQTSGIWEELYQDAKSYFMGEGPEVRGMLIKGKPAKSGWGLQAEGRRFYDVMPQDGFRECFCPKCHAAYDKQADPMNYATELVWGKTAELGRRLIAEGVPGTITQMAYVPYRAVPKVEIPTNVAVMVAETGPWSLGDEARFERDREEVRAWGRKTGGKVWMWNYAGKYACLGLDLPDIPLATPRATGEYYKRMANDVFGAYYESKTDRFIYHYLDFYVFAKVAWDNSTDVDALIAEHDRLMFGAAAKPMRRFFDALERKWLKDITGTTVTTPLGPLAIRPTDDELYTKVYSQEFLKELSRLLDEAAGMVAAGSMEARRIGFFRREYLEPLVAKVDEYRRSVSVERELAIRKVLGGKNLVRNGTFADGLKGWSPLKKEADGERTERTEVPEGEMALVLKATDETPTEPPYQRANVTQGVRGMKPETRYRLSYFVRLEDVRPVRRGGGVCVYFDAGKAVTYPAFRLCGTMGWRAQSFEFTTGKKVPASATVRPCIVMATGTAKFAGLRLEELPSLSEQIAAVSAAGGGTVEVPAGELREGTVTLRDNVTLKLAKGAVLQVDTIRAEGATNVAIVGEGRVDGGGDRFPFGSLEVARQPRLVHLKDCRGVRIEGVTLGNGRRWTCYLDNCDGVTIRKVTIRSLDQKCCDGIDIASRNVLVEDCDIETHDDAIVFKAPEASSRVENVEVRNCRLASNCAYIKVGSETKGTIRGIKVHDCTCKAASKSHEDRSTWKEFADCQVKKPPVAYAGISLAVLDGGRLEAVEIRDIDLGSAAMVPLFLRFGDRNAPSAGEPCFRGIRIENVRGASASAIGCSITGVPGRRIEDVVLTNIDLRMKAAGERSTDLPECERANQYVGAFGGLMPAWGLYLRHADRVKLENVRLSPVGKAKRPCYFEEDCTEVVR